jgi:hypothetical protein
LGAGAGATVCPQIERKPGAPLPPVAPEAATGAAKRVLNSATTVVAKTVVIPVFAVTVFTPVCRHSLQFDTPNTCKDLEVWPLFVPDCLDLRAIIP